MTLSGRYRRSVTIPGHRYQLWVEFTVAGPVPTPKPLVINVLLLPLPPLQFRSLILFISVIYLFEYHKFSQKVGLCKLDVGDHLDGGEMSSTSWTGGPVGGSRAE